ncbi:MAG: transposase [Candidatus Magnetobacterium sp. LHC-1]
METLFPSTIIAHISAFKAFFPANNFLYFQGFMLSYMLIGKSRKCVTNIAKGCFYLDKHISSIERFISQYQWDMNGVKATIFQLIRDRLREELLVCGAYLAWVDTTMIPKVKGKMPAVQRWHNHSGNSDNEGYIIGHHWAIAGLVSNVMLGGTLTTICWPLLTSLISGHLNSLGFIATKDAKNSRVQAMTFWDAVCPLVAQIHHLAERVHMRVVADAYFAKASFINPMLCMGVDVITRMRKDAVGWDDPPPAPVGKKKRGRTQVRGQEWKISKLLYVLPQEIVNVIIYGKECDLCVVVKDIWVRDVCSQKVRVVIIKNAKEPMILLSTDLTLSAAQIIYIYALRFSLELAIRDLKQHFGIGDYQCHASLPINRFVGLSLIGFCLWRLSLITDIEATWLQSDDQTSILSFTKISRAVRRFVLQGIFHKSASNADFNKDTAIPNEMLRLVI